MLMRCLLSVVGVTRRDSVNDDIMVTPQARGGTRCADDLVEMQMQQPLAFAQQFFVIADEVGVLARLGNRDMECLVCFGHRLEISRRHGLKVGSVCRTYALEVFLVVLRRSQTSHRSLNEIQRRHVIGEVLDLKGCGQRCPVGQDGDQALTDQSRQGVSDRRTAKTELRRERNFVQWRPWLELEREDLLAQLLVDISATVALGVGFRGVVAHWITLRGLTGCSTGRKINIGARSVKNLRPRCRSA